MVRDVTSATPRRFACAPMASGRACGCLALVVALLSAGNANAQSAPGSVPFKATGNEPGWTLDIGIDRITVVADNGATRVVVPLSPPARVEGGRRYESRTDSHTVVVTLLDKVCVDAMSGMPKPTSVEVTLDERTLKGCGGDATALLRGGPWIVTAVNGRPIAPGKAKLPMTMAFGASGRIEGTSLCNRYHATYVLTGEALTVTMPIATARGCDPPLMAQERLFLEVLRGIQRFELEEGGVLVLHGADGGTITARRE
jgi:heat shock protein HslJ